MASPNHTGGRSGDRTLWVRIHIPTHAWVEAQVRGVHEHWLGSGLTKVFLTDEVETRVLWDINLEIKRGDYVSIPGPPGQRHFRGSVVWPPR